MNITWEQFLSPFFESGEIVHLRVFDDKKGGIFKGLKLERELGKISALTETLQKHNAQGRGIFFVVNFGGDNDDEITRINAVFVENDKLPVNEQLAALAAFPLPPSLLVKTAKSVHAYWLTKDISVAEFRNYQRRLIARFDGDPACVNESRVLRLPGFNHCKGEPVMVECIKFSPELRYTKAQLDAALPELVSGEDAVVAHAPKGQRKGLTLIGLRCDFIRYCKDNAATLSESLWYAMITNLAVFEGGGKAIHTLSKAYPNYSHAETEDKIRHFLDSGTRPMTCAKICGLGFKCDKYEEGACGCKAPAALCYKPLPADGLLRVLNSLDIPAQPVEKIKVIKTFVQDYLYNIEPVIAETIINYEVKARFNFKAGDIAPLIKLHRDMYKRYADSRETRRETDGAELPDWYELTGKGGLRFLPFVLADHMAKNVAAFYGAGSYYFYDHGVYGQRDDLAAFAAVRSNMLKTAKANEIGDAEKQWRSAISRRVREINANPFIVNVRNGLLNVLDGSFKPHSAEYFSTVQINANYDPAASCPLFMAFLRNILPETEIPLIQELLGYLLIPVNKAQKSFVLVGAPNAGKSTLLYIAQDILLGSDNVSNIPWQALGDRFNKAELFGKLANIFADLPSKAIDDGGMFKALTGEDSISGERKNKDPFNFRPYARLLFSCNDIPKNYSDRSDGFYRRLLIIRFDKPVPPDKRDPNLRERIAAEADGILAWSLDGLRRLMGNSYIFSETTRTADELRRYKVESNSALTFLEECCEIAADAGCTREALFERYRDYCGKNGYKPLSQANFNKDIESSSNGIERGLEKVSRRKIWKGVRYAE